MNEEYNKIIINLNENIKRLKLLYLELKNENVNLSNEVNILNSELNIYKNKLDETEKKYDNLKLARNIVGKDGEDNEAKLKLNRIIREIDNCIALLNK